MFLDNAFEKMLCFHNKNNKINNIFLSYISPLGYFYAAIFRTSTVTTLAWSSCSSTTASRRTGSSASSRPRTWCSLTQMRRGSFWQGLSDLRGTACKLTYRQNLKWCLMHDKMAGKIVTSNIASARNQWLSKDSVFWLVQMTYVMA